MFRKWEVPLRMEKCQQSSCLKKNKNNKEELKNYRPISLLPVTGKILIKDDSNIAKVHL